MSDHLTTVQHIYQCFSRGDVPGILAVLANDVTFLNGSDPRVAPFGGEFKGKDGVVKFFTALGANAQTTLFEPSGFRVEDQKVINQVRHDGIAITTGKPFSVEVTFYWTFDEAGQVIDWKGQGDFSSINEAFLN